MNFEERVQQRADEYWGSFVGRALELVAEKRTMGWFRDKEEFLNYCRRGHTPAQLFVLDVAWDIEELAG